MTPLPYVANPVFVSHTGGMKQYASRAIDAVLHACCFPRDMRFFNAESDTPAEVCIREVEKCAIYVGVFGHDYGSPVRGRPDVSYTQLEFLTALAKMKRGQMKVFAFLLAGDPTDDRQRRFIGDVHDSGITASTFADAGELFGKIVAALAQLPQPRPNRPEQHRPYLTSNFTGRVDEIADILARIHAGNSQFGFVSGLKGTGGVGKTTLAAMIADHLNQPLRLPSGILWANLKDEPPHLIARKWLNDLGEPMDGERSAEELLARLHEVAGKSPGLLVVLDNAQPPKWGTCDAEKLLVKAPGVLTLITTRFQEALPRGVGSRNVDELSQADAEALLRRLIGPLFDEHPEAAREIVTRSGRLPLLLNPTYDVVVNEGVPLPDYARQLRDNALRVIGRHDPEVAAVFDLSWNFLKPLHRELFAILAWAPGETIGVNLARIWLTFFHADLLKETPSLPEQTLKKLANASMLIPSGDRYRYHDRARDYARLQIEKLGEKVANLETTVMGRLLRCWCDFDFVKAEFDAIGAYALADQYRLLNEWAAPKPKEFSPWYHFVRRDATLFAAASDAFVGMAAREAKDSPVALAALPAYRRENGFWVEWRNRTEKFVTPACLQILLGHSGYVSAVSVTPDGRRAVSGSRDRTLRVWDLERGMPGPVLRGDFGVVTAVSVTADGRRAVSSSLDDNLVRVWDLYRGIPGPILHGHTSYVNAVSVTADGCRAVSGAADRTVRVWDLERGTPGPVFEGHSAAVSAVSVTADGRRAVSGSNDKTGRVWDLERGIPGPVLHGHESYVNAVSVTADGRRAVSGSWDRTVRVWDLEHGTPGPVFEGHLDVVVAVSVTADGRRAVSGSGDKTVRAWDLERGTPGPVFEGHIHSLNAISVTADGRRAVSGSRDETVRVWDLEQGTPGSVFQRQAPHTSALSVAANGRRAVSASWDKTVRVWDLESGTPDRVFQWHSGPVNAVSVTADGRCAVSGSGDKTVRVWNLESSMPGPVLHGHTKDVWVVTVTADGRRAISGSGDKTVRVWDLERGIVGPILRGHTNDVKTVCMTADGRRGVSGSEDNTVRVWDLERGTPGHVLNAHMGSVRAVSVTADGRCAVSLSGDTVRMWDLETGECLAAHLQDTEEARQAWYMTDPQRRVWLFQEGHFLVYRAAPNDEIIARFPGSFGKFGCGPDGVNALAFDAAHQPYFLRLHRN